MGVFNGKGSALGPGSRGAPQRIGWGAAPEAYLSLPGVAVDGPQLVCGAENIPDVA